MKPRTLLLFALLLAMNQVLAAVITTNVETIAFGDVEVGYPVSTTFTVSGEDLSDNIYLSVMGRKSSYYTVTPQTITPQNAAGGVTVTVKCMPSSQYITPASVVLTSSNAEDVIIPISVSLFYPSEMFVNNQTEQFTALVGQMATHTGTIRFADAEVPHDPNTPVVRSSGAANIAPWVSNGYSLSIEGADSHCFSARVVKSSSLANICTVAVSYAPRSTGSHEATLKVVCSNAGVPLVTIPLRGESTGFLCDMDENGLLDISDLTGIIGVVLNESKDPTRGDFDEDGKCDINDVTKFISFLLAQ